MKKRLLILMLVLMLALTACGKAKEMSAAEKNAMDSFVETMNISAGELFTLKFEEDSRTLLVIVEDGSEVEDADALRKSMTQMSEGIVEDVGEGYTVSLVYYSDKKNPLLMVKDEKITKDNLDKVIKKQSEKKEEVKETEKVTKPTEAASAEPLTSQQQNLMNAYLEGGNSSDVAKNGLIKVEFDNSTRTYYVLYADDVTITDASVIRKASIGTTTDLSTHIGENITVKVAYSSKKDSPLLVLRDGKIIEDNLN